MNRRASSKRSPAPETIGGIDPDALKIQPNPRKKLLAFKQRICGMPSTCITAPLNEFFRSLFSPTNRAHRLRRALPPGPQ